MYTYPERLNQAGRKAFHHLRDIIGMGAASDICEAVLTAVNNDGIKASHRLEIIVANMVDHLRRGHVGSAATAGTCSSK